jgi:hypothetical protein
MDRRHCILLALGIFLEEWCEAALGLGKEHLFPESVIPKCAKGTIYKILKEVWGKAEFVCLALEPLGTHSTWKSPATHDDRCCGGSKDDTDSCGRWRKCRIQDCCVSVNLPCPDAKLRPHRALGVHACASSNPREWCDNCLALSAGGTKHARLT